ncbi:MAG: flagellar export chaperone FliS [Sandaracinus sp.]|nr:flagellar export chaperone FliS [Sandaracinus sp.]MCB9632497.1 flagellar export chaperone FliS [Sandaracinus sp.]
MSFALQRYRSSRTETASPVQVLVQLYEAALRYLREVHEAIEVRDPKRKGIAVAKAHAIVVELQATLDHDKAPELCERLHALYDFCLARIATANTGWDAAAADEAAQVLDTLRSAWAEIAAGGR